ncbi:hypothetical protein D3C85_1356050 [compost metagenome]
MLQASDLILGDLDPICERRCQGIWCLSLQIGDLLILVGDPFFEQLDHRVLLLYQHPVQDEQSGDEGDD